VIGAVVLGLGPALPGRTGTAEAIAAGFGAAAVAFAVAVIAGVLLLDAPRWGRRSPRRRHADLQPRTQAG